MGPSDGSDGEVLAEGPHALLRAMPDGYEVHRHDRDAVERFPRTDEGSDQAWDRYLEVCRQGRIGRLLTALVPVAVLAGALWLAMALVAALVTLGFGLDRVSGDNEIARWLAYASEFGQAVSVLFIGAVGSYVVLWLYRKGIPSAGNP